MPRDKYPPDPVVMTEHGFVWGPAEVERLDDDGFDTGIAVTITGYSGGQVRQIRTEVSYSKRGTDVLTRTYDWWNVQTAQVAAMPLAVRLQGGRHKAHPVTRG